MKRRGFTLVEIMVVLLIIGMLAMIAVPGWIRVRQTSREQACRENRRILDAAKLQWAMDKLKGATDVAVDADLFPEFIKSKPICPESGTYTFGTVNDKTDCSEHGSD